MIAFQNRVGVKVCQIFPNSNYYGWLLDLHNKIPKILSKSFLLRGWGCLPVIIKGLMDIRFYQAFNFYKQWQKIRKLNEADISELKLNIKGLKIELGYLGGKASGYTLVFDHFHKVFM